MTDVIDHLYRKEVEAQAQKAVDIWAERYANIKAQGVESLPSTLSDQWRFASAEQAVDGLLEIICRMAADIARLEARK